MLYVLIRQLIRIVLAIFYRPKVGGLHHVPKTGPVVICSNHISYLDPLLVGSALRRKIHFMAKQELFRVPLLSPLIRQLGAFPVKRGGGDKQALKHSMQLMKEGKMLGIFPEGTRSKTGELGEAHPGAALIALKTNATIVPTAIIGSYRLFHPVRIVFGEPIDVTPYTQEKVTTGTAQVVTNRIMQQMKEMIRQSR